MQKLIPILALPMMMSEMMARPALIGIFIFLLGVNESLSDLIVGYHA